jgi:hypothetical protein
MMFFTFRQNNSGGYFKFDEREGITHFVIIEARDAQQANLIAERNGIYFSGCRNGVDCNCRGDRWNPVDDNDGNDEPRLYGETIEEFINDKWYSADMKPDREICVHNANGNLTWYG